MKNTPSRFLCLAFFAFLAISYESSGQQDSDSSSYFKYRYINKKFIDKIEFFAGSGLSFNYGNKLVENYRDENASNKRLGKMSHTFGIGLCRQISKRIDFFLRFQYEIKGRKTELNTPLTLPEYRRINQKNYTYQYLTVSGSLQFYLDAKNDYFFSLGGYYGKISGFNGYEKIFDSQDLITYEGNPGGRNFEEIGSNGMVHTITWISGLRSFELFDFGAIISFGRSVIDNKKQKITVSVTDNLGLSNINKNKPFNQEEKNHTLRLQVAYILKR